MSETGLPDVDPAPEDVVATGAHDTIDIDDREDQAPERPRWVRVARRTLFGAGVTLLILVALVVVLYFFGGMERPAPEFRAAYASLVAQGSATAIEERFTIPIPGCRCHSDDAVQQVQHSTYRISECRSCH